MFSIIFILFCTVFGIQMLYYFYFYLKFVFHKKIQKEEKNKKSVSVIICAKDEAPNCLENIPFILAQDYPNFELVLVNDTSTDTTLDVFKKFATQYDNIKIVDVKHNERIVASKKYALSLGIKAANNEHLLFTDADCKPSSKNWISEMVASFDADTELILGYGAYEKQNGFLNKLIRYETMLTALHYFSFQLRGLTYMGVGRNLAYTKSLFVANNGFYAHMHIQSGDDDLFVNAAATKTNTRIHYTKNAHTISKPKTSLKAWFRQKRRHISTANQYKKNHQALLAMHFVSLFLFWSFALFLLIYSYQWQVVLLLFAVKLGLQYFIMYKTAEKLNEKDLIIFSPILEFVLLLLQLAQFLYNTIRKPLHWN